jgi:signal peptidase I
MGLSRSQRKSARLTTKSVERLVSKYGERIGDDACGDVQNAMAAVQTAVDADDSAALAVAVEVLETRVEKHLGQYRKSPTREYIESIGWAVAIALVLRTFVVEAFTIPSGSMIPTLAVGDFLFVNKLAFGLRLPMVNRLVAEWDSPDRGDVIVFVYPCNERQDYIKRVVGIGGDTVNVDPLGFVRVNGEPQREALAGPFAELEFFTGKDYGSNACPGNLTAYQAQLDAEKFRTLHCGGMEQGHWPATNRPAVDWSVLGRYQQCDGAVAGRGSLPPMPWRVPDGHVFVMGDNRGNSADSRYWGFVPHEYIKGKSLFIWMSWDGSVPWGRPLDLVRWGRLFEGVHGDFGREG